MYILKRIVQYRPLQELKTFGAFQDFKFVMWKTQGCLNVAQTNVNTVRRKMGAEVFFKKKCLKSREISTTES